MRVFIESSGGHFRGEFLSGGTVGTETEHRITHKLAELLSEKLAEYNVQAPVLQTANRPGLLMSERNSQGVNTLVIKLSLEKSVKLDPLYSIVTIRHNGLPSTFVESLTNPLISWASGCVSGRPAVLGVEDYPIQAESLVLSVVPFRFGEMHSVMFAQRLESLSTVLCRVLVSQKAFLESPRQLRPSVSPFLTLVQRDTHQ